MVEKIIPVVTIALMAATIIASIFEYLKIKSEIKENSNRNNQNTQSIPECLSSLSTAYATSSEGLSELMEVISVLNEVAEQTNIAALNAAVDAARAGEQGVELKVIVNEVQALSKRSKITVDEIIKILDRTKQAHDSEKGPINIIASQFGKG